MRVVLNVAFDRVGVGFWAFRDVRVRGRASRYADWFGIARFDDPKTAADDMDYATYMGTREMPSVRRQGDTLAPGPHAYVLSVLSRWSDPNGDGDPADGVDGWRFLDAERLPMGFLREARKHVLARSPDAALLGEIFWEDRENEILRHPLPWLRGDVLDAVTQHRWSAAVRAFFFDKTASIQASEFDGRVGVLRAEVPWETTLAQLLALDGPHTERIGSQGVNADRGYDRRSSPREDPTYDIRAPRVDEWRKARLVATLQFTSPGVPVIWYGSEAGLWGADEPDSHKPMLWKDFTFEDEATHPFGQKRPRDKVRFDEDMTRFYQLLGRLRQALPALRKGTSETLVVDDSRRVLAFERAFDGQRVICAFNASDRETTVDVAFDPPSRELLSGRRLRSREGRTLIPVPAQSAAIVAAETAVQP
jgi:glycosidase